MNQGEEIINGALTTLTGTIVDYLKLDERLQRMMDNPREGEVVQGEEVVLMMQDRKKLNASRTEKLQVLLQHLTPRKHQTKNQAIYLNILNILTQTILQYLQLDAAMTQMLDNVEENEESRMHQGWMKTRILLNSDCERQLAELYQYPEQKKSSKDKRKKAVAILTETIMKYLNEQS